LGAAKVKKEIFARQAYLPSGKKIQMDYLFHQYRRIKVLMMDQIK